MQLGCGKNVKCSFAWELDFGRWAKKFIKISEHCYLCLNLLNVMYVPFSVFCVLFVGKCVLFHCHRVSTHLKLNISYHIISYHIICITYHIIYHINIFGDS
jgi:hypothetical protein